MLKEQKEGQCVCNLMNGSRGWGQVGRRSMQAHYSKYDGKAIGGF